MIKIPKIDFPQLKSKLQVKSPWDRFIIMVLSLLITIPIFIILHQNLIDLKWPFNLDRIFIFLFVFAAVFFLLMLLRTIIIICIALYLLVLFYGSVIGNYGFNEISEDYNSMIYTMSDNPYPQDIIVAKFFAVSK